MTWQQKVWKGGQTVFYAVRPLLLYLFLPGILRLIGQFLIGGVTTDAAYQKSTGNFYNFIGMLLVIFLLYRASKKRGNTIFQETTLVLDHPDRRYLALCAGLGAASALAFSAAITVLPLPAWLIGGYEAESERIFRQFDFLLAILNLIVVSPVMEELVVRGYLLNRLFDFFSEKWAVFLSSLIFAACHVNLFWVAYAFVLGVFMARLALRRDNTLYSLGFHVGFNLPAAVNAWILRMGLGESVFFKSRLLIMLYGAAAAAAAVLLYRQMEKEDRQI